MRIAWRRACLLKEVLPRVIIPYGIPNTNEGYELAGNIPEGAPWQVRMALIKLKERWSTRSFALIAMAKKARVTVLTVTAGGHPPPPAYDSQTLKNLT